MPPIQRTHFTEGDDLELHQEIRLLPLATVRLARRSQRLLVTAEVTPQPEYSDLGAMQILLIRLVPEARLLVVKLDVTIVEVIPITAVLTAIVIVHDLTEAVAAVTDLPAVAVATAIVLLAAAVVVEAIHPVRVAVEAAMVVLAAEVLLVEEEAEDNIQTSLA